MPHGFARATRDVGFPVAVAGILLYAFIFRVPAEIGELADVLREVNSANGQRLERLEDGQRQALEALARLLERERK